MISPDLAVTGASGLIGKALCQSLEDRGFQILKGGRSGDGSSTPPLDITAASSVEMWLRSAGSVKTVVHLAARAHRATGYALAGPEVARVNIGGTANLLRAAVAYGVRRFVYASSSAVYPPWSGKAPLPEEAARAPADPYGASKWEAERLVIAAGANVLEVVILRFPPVYHREQMTDIRKRVIIGFPFGKRLLRFWPTEPCHALCALENAVEALQLAIEGRLGVGIFNVADAGPYRLAALREAMRAVDHVDREVIVPSAIGRAATAVLGAVPGPRAATFRGQLVRLFRGQVLDTAAIGSRGFRPNVNLADVAS